MSLPNPETRHFDTVLPASPLQTIPLGSVLNYRPTEHLLPPTNPHLLHPHPHPPCITPPSRHNPSRSRSRSAEVKTRTKRSAPKVCPTESKHSNACRLQYLLLLCGFRPVCHDVQRHSAVQSLLTLCCCCCCLLILPSFFFFFFFCCCCCCCLQSSFSHKALLFLSPSFSRFRAYCLNETVTCSPFALVDTRPRSKHPAGTYREMNRE